MTDFTLKAGDTSPTLTATLTASDGTALDLSGASVQFQMRPSDATDGTLTVDAPATVTDPANGRVRYAWSSAETATAGRYHAEFDVEYADGSTETVPNAGWFFIHIRPQL